MLKLFLSTDTLYPTENQSIQYIIKITNTIGITATNITVVDTIPSGLTFVPASVLVNGIAIFHSVPCTGIRLNSIVPNGIATITFLTKLTTTTTPDYCEISNNAFATYSYNNIIQAPSVSNDFSIYPNISACHECATTIPTLFNTGVNYQGQLLLPNEPDPHYILTTAPYCPLLTAQTTAGPGYYPLDGTWAILSNTAQWIIPGKCSLTLPANCNYGTYIYETTFNLDGFDPSTVEIQGNWSADNKGVNIYLNGNKVFGPTTASKPWLNFSQFQINSKNIFPITFNQEENKLSFEVFNDDQATGLLVEMVGTACPHDYKDIVIIKTVDKSIATVGSILTYSISIENRSQLTLDSFNLIDNFPPSVIIDLRSITSNPLFKSNSSTDHSLYLTYDTLGPTEKINVIFNVEITCLASSTLFNTATLISKNATFNSNTVETRLNSAVLQLLNMKKSVDLTSATIGSILKYTIKITNPGPLVANNITFSDNIPQATELLPETIKVNNNPRKNDNPYNNAVTLTLPPLPGCSSVTIEFQVRIVNDTITSEILNTANSTYFIAEIPSSSSSNTVSTFIEPHVETIINVIKKSDKPSANVNELITYTLTIESSGPENAYNLILTDKIPLGAELVANSIKVNDKDYNNLGNKDLVKLDLGYLTNNSTMTVVFRIKVLFTCLKGIDGSLQTINVLSNFASLNYNFSSSPTYTTKSNTTTTNLICTPETIPTLFNTGVNNKREKLGDKSLETHYKLISSPITPTPILQTPIKGYYPLSLNAWRDLSTIANWITSTCSFTDGNTCPQGDYLYETIFDLSQFNINTIKITGSWAVDNSGFDIDLNGKSLNIKTNTIPNPWDAFSNFIIDNSTPNAKFTSGINSLVFKVYNMPASPNKSNATGLLVRLIGKGCRCEIPFIKIVNRVIADIEDELTYTFKINNLSNTNMENVILLDTIPENTTFVHNSVIINGITKPESNPSIGINIGTILPSIITTVSFKIKVTPIGGMIPGSINNIALLNYSYIDEGLVLRDISISSNLVSTAINHGQISPADTSNTANKTTTFPGDEITYTITAKNSGSVSIYDVTIQNYLPEGTSLVPGSITINKSILPTEADISNLSLNNNNLTFSSISINVGTLYFDEIVTVTFKALVLDNAPKILENTPFISYRYIVDDTTNPVSAGVNTPTFLITNEGLIADLKILKSCTKSSVMVGDVITFTLVVTNAGAFDLYHVTIYDPLSPSLKFIDNSVRIDSLPSPSSILTGVSLGSLAIGEGKTIEFDAKVISDTVNPINNSSNGSYEYTIEGTCPQYGSSESNVISLIVEKTNLCITKKIDKNIISVGGTLTFTITIKNVSSINVFNAILRDTIQAGTEFVPGSFYLDGIFINLNESALNRGINLGIIKVNETIIAQYDVKISSPLQYSTVIDEATVEYTY